MRTTLVVSIICATAFALGAEKQKIPDSITGPERSAEWLGAVERIRLQPRAGEIQNAGVQCHIVEIVAPSETQKAAEILKRYEAESIRQLAACEAELKKIRAKYEAELLQTLPENRREAAGRALAISHESWHTPLEIDAKLRAALIERQAKAAAPAGRDALKTAREELSAWLRAEHKKLTAGDANAIESIAGLLNPEEQKRIQEFDKNRETGEKPGNTKK